jgi:hypothetical protein
LNRPEDRRLGPGAHILHEKNHPTEGSSVACSKVIVRGIAVGTLYCGPRSHPAPSCYRISFLSGALEVTARLKSGDDLELLVKVLEANKALFAKADRLAAEVLTLTKELGSSASSQSHGEPGAALVTC